MQDLVNMAARNGSSSHEQITLEKVRDKSSNVIEEGLNLEIIPKGRWWIDLIALRHKRQEVIKGRKVLDTRLGTGCKLNVQRGPERFEGTNVISRDGDSSITR